MRKRLTNDLSFDVNYTFAHSLDIASGNQAGTSFGAPFVLNPLDLNVNRGHSDFDIRHLVTADWVYNLPFGNGKRFGNGARGFVNALVGGWTLTGIFRYNSGRPVGAPGDADRWATNWNAQSNGVALRPVESSPTRTGDPNIFEDPQAAFQSYRNARPGEFGDRNTIRLPSYFTIDPGLYKAFRIKENLQLKFRWEVFNATNSQSFTTLANFSLPQDPFNEQAPSDFGRFTQIQGNPRVMQFALRIEF